ncbi:HXXEE domain-containing protein [Haloferax sp. YSSS75]|uniref:HXXEE domain-containing protein n=1 Tax=Haloferax sp. YSSS75 TaxID=3388564 RepID=UPI00398CE136
MSSATDCPLEEAMLAPRLSVVVLLWVLPISWVVHDVEEILTIEPWSRRWTRRIDGQTSGFGVQKRLVAVLASTRRQYTLAVGLVGCIVVGATIAGTLDPTGVGLVVYLTILGGYFLHAFVHLGQSALLRGYTPGVVTAVLVVVPSSLFLYWRLFAAGVVDARLVAVTATGGLLSFVPIVVGANWAARRLDDWGS